MTDNSHQDNLQTIRDLLEVLPERKCNRLNSLLLEDLVPKTFLSSVAQSLGLAPPTYSSVRDGADNCPTFTAECQFAGFSGVSSESIYHTKVSAESSAAFEICEIGRAHV